MNGTFSTAILRSVGLAIFMVVGAGWAVYAQSGDWRTAITAAITAAGLALGGRGLAEGAFDAKRQAAGDVKPSDVQLGDAGKS